MLLIDLYTITYIFNVCILKLAARLYKNKHLHPYTKRFYAELFYFKIHSFVIINNLLPELYSNNVYICNI